jgi:hypothetical protein
MVGPMATKVTASRRCLALLLAVLLAGVMPMTSPDEAAGAGPGDTLAPSVADGDWWNYTVAADVYIPLHLGTYTIALNRSSGNLGFEVRGTIGMLGQVGWQLRVEGKLRLTGTWTGAGGGGPTVLDADVMGWEYRSVADLALLGSSILYSGMMEINPPTGPENLQVAEWVNTTLSAPLRLMTLPIPFSQRPKEEHSVDVTIDYRAPGFELQREQLWEYTTEYKGLADVKGSTITFVNQHRFAVLGNITEGGRASRLDASIYYDPINRKAVSVDQVTGREINEYHVKMESLNPDLVVVKPQFTASDYIPVRNHNVTFNATVHNIGLREVLQVRVELWATIEGGISEKVNQTVVPSLAANSNEAVDLNWTAEDVGDWTFTIKVDPFNSIIEEREYNNEVELNLTVVFQVKLPNLHVTEDSVILDPVSPVDNRTTVELSVDVLNEGPGDAWNVTVDWYLENPAKGGQAIGWRRTVDFIRAGESTRDSMIWTANIPGEHRLYVVIDSNNTVPETSEVDNVAYAPIIIVPSPFGSVDLTIVRIRVLDAFGRESTQLPSGERGSIEVVISNAGPKNATNVYLALYVDAITPVGKVGFKEGRIDANYPVAWTVPWTIAGADGNHTIIANAVALGQAEGDTDDNTRTFTFKIGPRIAPPPETLTLTVYPKTTLPKPGASLNVSGKVVKMSDGSDVPDATVKVSFKGTNIEVTARTNQLGRYFVTIDVPAQPGAYRLEVDVEQGFNTGTSYVLISVEGEPLPPPDDGGDARPSWALLIILIVVMAAVVGPLAFVGLRTIKKRHSRIRKVHETVLEITEKRE